jgi:RHS repeat-associated protein
LDFIYDRFGRDIEHRTTSGTITIIKNTTYDNAGRVYTISQPHYLNQSYYSTTNHYDSLRGYLNRQDNPDGTYKTILLTGFTEVITDERGHSRRIIKDSLGRVKEIVEPTNGVTEYGYDIFNNLIYVKDPVGNKTFIYYNDLGQKTSMDDPYMGHWEYRYDPNGNLNWQKDSGNRITTISYDDINRVYQKNYQTDNRIVTHTYDQIRAGYFNKGALTTLSSPEAVYEFNYDNMGREVKETRTIDSTSYQTERQYDIAGRLEYIIYPDTGRTRYNYQYNGMGYLKEVRKQGASYPYINIQDTDYNALGQIKNSHYGNGLNTAYAYYEDGSYRLKDITTTRNGTPIQYIHYEFDEAGNIEAMDVTTHTNAAYTVNHDFTYDALNRLKTATATCSNDSSRSYNQGYTYDLAGNMTNKTGIGGWDVLTWESGVNRPRIRPKSVRFDAEVAGIANRNVINNQDQKPVQITYQGVTTNLYYDGAGERIKKVKGAETVVYVGGIFEVRNGQAMSYVYANGQKIVTLANNKEYYTHSDHRGSTGIVTDETGTVVEEIGYLPFGSTLFRNTYSGSTWASSYRFTGQEFDPEYDLYNYNARLYDPIMSRFITPDTIVPNPYNPQSLNRYTYCHNNPLNYIDPSGHTSMTYDEWQAYMAMVAQAYSLYGVWPQMGLIMLHDISMGFDSFQTGFEVRAVDPDTVILAQLLAGVQASGGGDGKSSGGSSAEGARYEGLQGFTMRAFEIQRHESVMKQIDGYSEIIQKSSSKYGVDPNLVRAIIYEEQTHNKTPALEWMPGVNSVGPMAVHNLNWGKYGNYSRWQMIDPKINIDVGTQILSKIVNELGVNYTISNAAAMYNSGQPLTDVPRQSILYGNRVEDFYNRLFK